MGRTWTPRERVLKALGHEEPDRVPIDLGGNQTGIHKAAYQAVLEYLGMTDEITLMDAVQQLARPCEAVLERFGIDTRYISAGTASSYKGGIKVEKRDGKIWHDLWDEFGVRWSMPDDQQLYMDITYHPLAGATLAGIEVYPFPRGDDAGRFEGLRERALEIRNHTPYALVSGISGVVYETCWYMRGLEQWYCDMLNQPSLCETLLDRILQYWMDWFRVFLDEVGDLVDVIMIGDDLAGQSGPLFNPSFYRKTIQPRHQKLVHYIRSRTKARLWYHTCGSCVEFIPYLIDNGIHILNPVQVGSARMDPAVLKKKFGKRLVFWGGAVDPQHVLPKAGSHEVREQAMRNMKAFMPGGGYVFSAVHNIQAGVPPENIVMLFDTALECGRYG